MLVFYEHSVFLEEAKKMKSKSH